MSMLILYYLEAKQGPLGVKTLTKITKIWYQTPLDAFFGFYTFMTFSFIGLERCEQAFKLLRLGQGNTYNPGVEAASPEAERFYL